MNTDAINTQEQKRRGKPPKTLINNTDKQCVRCGDIKDSSLFRKNRFLCLECHRVEQRNFYKNNENYRMKKINNSIERYKKSREQGEGSFGAGAAFIISPAF
jgi:hypothetical protein